MMSHDLTLQLPDIPSLVASLTASHDDMATHAKIGLPAVIADPDPTATRCVCHDIIIPIH